jgi:hypothetical protein
MGILNGRLLFPLRASLARVDYTGTRNAGGYDVHAKQPRVSYINPGTSAEQRVVSTEYLAPVLLLAQIKRGRWHVLAMGPGGNVPDSKLVLIMHTRELTQKGLIDPSNGEVRLKIGDKLLGLFKKNIKPSPIPTQTIDGLPGMFLTEITPGGEGLGGDRNLFKLTFDDRPQGISR